jgi:hypothetical protein
MKKLAIALCIISTQAFGMESKKSFRNLAQLQTYLADELSQGRLKQNVFNFAYRTIRAAALRIKRETEQRHTHTFAYMLKRETAFSRKFEKNTIRYVENFIATQKKEPQLVPEKSGRKKRNTFFN